MVGAVLLSKSCRNSFSREVGSGRFAKLACHHGDSRTLVGSFEIVCGAIVLLGFATRLLHSVANHMAWPFTEPSCPSSRSGFGKWRTRQGPIFSMVWARYSSVVGAGAYSVDAWLLRRFADDFPNANIRDSSLVTASGASVPQTPNKLLDRPVLCLRKADPRSPVFPHRVAQGLGGSDWRTGCASKPPNSRRARRRSRPGPKRIAEELIN